MRGRSTVDLIVRPGAGRSGTARVSLLAAAVCALVLAVPGHAGLSAASGALAREPSTAGEGPAAAPLATTYTLMQMNLCLSGSAGCYGRVAYPAVVEEAVARIRDAHPDAVTVNEACRRDVARIADQTGYHARFSAVTSSAGPLRCIRPERRGRFGDAVLTKAATERGASHDFEALAGDERRRWLCVTTRDIDVCTAHLATRSTIEAAGSEAQCAEVATILARRMAAHPVIFGGDVNRFHPCAPDGVWTRTDSGADQAAGFQHVYGSRALRSPTVQVLPAEHTDHDFLLIRAHRAAVAERVGWVRPASATGR